MGRSPKHDPHFDPAYHAAVCGGLPSRADAELGEFDYAAYAAQNAAERAAEGVAPLPAPDANPAIANPTAVVATLPSEAAITAARLAAFDCAAAQVREFWRAGRLSWVMRMENIPGEPFRFAPYVALDALIAACPEVAPRQLARALGFDRPDDALDMLPAKKHSTAWPAAHVSAVVTGLLLVTNGGAS